MIAKTQIDHPLIKLTCRHCGTRDFGDTNGTEAHSMGWTKIIKADDPKSFRITNDWFTHKGTCPLCLKKINRRRKENEPMIAKVVRHLLTVTTITMIVAIVLALVERPAAAAPEPSPPRLPTDIGGCCYGSGAQSDATSTRADCADRAQSPTGQPGMFVQGVFSDTDDDNAYCNVLPGGD